MTAPSAAPPTTGRVARWVAAVGLAAAAVVHALAVLDHVEHGLAVAGFFLVVAPLQLAAAVRVLQPSRATTRTLVGIVAFTAGLLLLYVVSRRVPLPLHGHSVDRPEDADTLGTLAVVAEVVALAALPSLLSPGARRVVLNSLLLTGLLVWIAWLTGYLG